MGEESNKSATIPLEPTHQGFQMRNCMIPYLKEILNGNKPNLKSNQTIIWDEK